MKKFLKQHKKLFRILIVSCVVLCLIGGVVVSATESAQIDSAIKYVVETNTNNVLTFSNDGLISPTPRVSYYQYQISELSVNNAMYYFNLPNNWSAGTKIYFHFSLVYNSPSYGCKLGYFTNGTFNTLVNASLIEEIDDTGYYRYYFNYTYTVGSTTNLQFYLHTNSGLLRFTNCSIYVDDALAIMMNADTNTNKIINEINSAESNVINQITANQNKNTQEQIKNDDENHQEQIDNDNQNTDRILDEGSDSAPSDDDKAQVDNLNDAENELINNYDTATILQTFADDSLFVNFISNSGNTFRFLSKRIDTYWGYGWVRIILLCAIFLGMVPVVFNVANSLKHK